MRKQSIPKQAATHQKRTTRAHIPLQRWDRRCSIQRAKGDTLHSEPQRHSTITLHRQLQQLPTRHYRRRHQELTQMQRSQLPRKRLRNIRAQLPQVNATLPRSTQDITPTLHHQALPLRTIHTLPLKLSLKQPLLRIPVYQPRPRAHPRPITPLPRNGNAQNESRTVRQEARRMRYIRFSRPRQAVQASTSGSASVHTSHCRRPRRSTHVVGIWCCFTDLTVFRCLYDRWHTYNKVNEHTELEV